MWLSDKFPKSRELQFKLSSYEILIIHLKPSLVDLVFLDTFVLLHGSSPLFSRILEEALIPLSHEVHIPKLLCVLI